MVTVHILASVGAREVDVSFSNWAWYVVYARIFQSIVHWAGTSETLVALRFLGLVIQFVFLGRMAYHTVYNE